MAKRIPTTGLLAALLAAEHVAEKAPEKRIVSKGRAETGTHHAARIDIDDSRGRLTHQRRERELHLRLAARQRARRLSELSAAQQGRARVFLARLSDGQCGDQAKPGGDKEG